MFNAGVKPETCVAAMIAVNNAIFIAFMEGVGTGVVAFVRRYDLKMERNVYDNYYCLE